MIDVLVVGAAGRMGSLVTTTVDRQDDMRTVALVDPAFGSAAAAPRFAGLDAALAAAKPQVAVEFSLPATVFDNTLRLLAAGVPTVVGATGLDDEMISRLAQSAAKHAVGLVVAPNFALGAVLLMRFARQAAQLFGRAEVVELHHEGKIDAPSGTALCTAKLMADEPGSAVVPGGHDGPSRGQDVQGIRIHSVRLPGLVAHQEVLFGGEGELLTLRHDCTSLECFMAGVLLAVRRVGSLKDTVVGLENILD
jgi:4-hydroxy-tetrahydrodipicolinate reductase